MKLERMMMGLFLVAGMSVANTAPTPVIVSCAMREGTTLMDITYRVNDPDDAVVSAWPLAFVDGTRSFAKVIRPATFAEGTENNFGTNVLANTDHQLVWNVGADWNIDLGQIKFEIICKDSRGLLSFEWLAIPSTTATQALSISKNVPTTTDVLDALLYQFAARDNGLSVSNGVLSGTLESGVYSGIELVNGATTKIYASPYLMKRINLQPALTNDICLAIMARSGLQSSTEAWNAVKNHYNIRSLLMVYGGTGLYGQANIPVGLANVSTIAGGYYHSLAIMKGGVVGWGYNTSGQCNNPVGLTNVLAIAAGRDHSLALKSDGTVAAWGQNTYGQCNVPIGLTTVTAIAAGFTHNLAVTNNGVVVAWGQNTGGQCNVPAGLTGVVAVAGGQYHSLALKNDGTVVAWGQNSPVYKQCNIPAGLSDVTAIAVGQYHNLALKKDGTVVAWGHNALGQCNVPAGLTNVTAIAAGVSHSLALKSNGQIEAWGWNASGQCNIPNSLARVTAIAAGFAHTTIIVAEPTEE